MLPILLEAAPDPMTKWIMIALSGGAILYLTLIRPAMKKKDPLSKQQPSTPMAANRLAAQRDTERVMQNLLVELAEMSRQISAQLDTRSQKLELLMQQADERIAALRQMQGERATPALFRQVESPVDLYTPRETLIEPPRPALGDDARHQEIYAMADNGRGASDIARELGRPRGEVELILALRPRQ